MTGVFSRKLRGRLSHRDPERSSHVMMEAEIGVMLLQAKEHRGLPATTRRGEEASDNLPLRASRRSQP